MGKRKNSDKQIPSVLRFDISKTTLEEEETDLNSSEHELTESERVEMTRILLLENDLEDELEEWERSVVQRMSARDVGVILTPEDEDADSSISISTSATGVKSMLLSQNDLANGLEEWERTVVKKMSASEMSVILISEDEDTDSSISTPTTIAKRSVCEKCARFHYAAYKRVRVGYALLAIDKTPGQIIDCDDYYDDDDDIFAIPLTECCIQYYSKWL
jgi:hypothetical protein